MKKIIISTLFAAIAPLFLNAQQVVYVQSPPPAQKVVVVQSPPPAQKVVYVKNTPPPPRPKPVIVPILNAIFKDKHNRHRRDDNRANDHRRR